MRLPWYISKCNCRLLKLGCILHILGALLMPRWFLWIKITLLVFVFLLSVTDSPAQQRPWMDTSLSPDQRADLVLKELTLEEKIELLHGNGMPGWPGPPHRNAF